MGGGSVLGMWLAVRMMGCRVVGLLLVLLLLERIAHWIGRVRAMCGRIGHYGVQCARTKSSGRWDNGC